MTQPIMPKIPRPSATAKPIDASFAVKGLFCDDCEELDVLDGLAIEISVVTGADEEPPLGVVVGDTVGVLTASPNVGSKVTANESSQQVALFFPQQYTFALGHAVTIISRFVS